MEDFAVHLLRGKMEEKHEILLVLPSSLTHSLTAFDSLPRKYDWLREEVGESSCRAKFARGTRPSYRFWDDDDDDRVKSRAALCM